MDALEVARKSAGTIESGSGSAKQHHKNVKDVKKRMEQLRNICESVTRVRAQVGAQRAAGEPLESR